MDNQSHILYLDTRSTHTAAVKVLALVAAYKGLETRYEPFPNDYSGEQHTIGARLRKITVHGFWPAFEFLNDIYRVPEILNETPEGRATIRTITDHLLRGKIAPETLNERYLSRGHIHLPQRFNLVDLAVAVLDYRNSPGRALREALAHLTVPQAMDYAHEHTAARYML